MGDLDLFVIDVLMNFDFELEAERFLLTSFKVTFKLPAISVDCKEALSKVHFEILFIDAGERDGEVESVFVGSSFKTWSLDRDFIFHNLILLIFWISEC